MKQEIKELKELSEADIIKIQFMELLSIINLLLVNIESYMQYLHIFVLQKEKKVELHSKKPAVDLYKEITDKKFVPKIKKTKEMISTYD